MYCMDPKSRKMKEIKYIFTKIKLFNKDKTLLNYQHFLLTTIPFYELYFQFTINE
jgi:hypothetical protein